MKYIVIGDIHGRDEWAKVIEVEKDYDKIIFLGDYVSTHEDISEEKQCSNLEDILNFKESTPDKVVLLRGNHDLQHLGYSWAECSGEFKKVKSWMTSIRERFLALTQWVYVDEENKLLFSHAGVSKTWFSSTKLKKVSEINSLEPSSLFGFTPSSPWDYAGYSKTQPPVWIRPKPLLQDPIPKYTQIVGHTPVGMIYNMVSETESDIWFCDNFPQQYLVIEDRVFITKFVGTPEIFLPNRYHYKVSLVGTDNPKEWLLKCDDDAGGSISVGFMEDKILSVDPSGGPYLKKGTKVSRELVVDSIRKGDKGYIIKFE